MASVHLLFLTKSDTSWETADAYLISIVKELLDENSFNGSHLECELSKAVNFQSVRESCVIVSLQSTSFIRMTMCVQKFMQTAVSSLRSKGCNDRKGRGRY